MCPVCAYNIPRRHGLPVVKQHVRILRVRLISRHANHFERPMESDPFFSHPFSQNAFGDMLRNHHYEGEFGVFRQDREVRELVEPVPVPKFPARDPDTLFNERSGASYLVQCLVL